jgi:hypothetical protein
MSFSSGSNISQWRDKSGLTNHATGVNSPVLSANAISTYQAVTTTTNQYFTGPTSVTGTTLTVFAVALTTKTLPNASSDQRLVSLANGANVDYGRADGVIALFNQGGSSSITTWRLSSVAGSGITRNVPFQTVSKYDGTTGYLWEDGTLGGSSASSGTFAVTKYGIGNQANPTVEYWIGSIGEVLIYNVSLDDTQRQTIESYLAQKWGLTGALPAGHRQFTQPAGKPNSVTDAILGIYYVLKPSTSSPITDTVLNTIATYLRNFMSEFRNPSFYGYNLDGTSYSITDGGGDMYDTGNWTYPWLISGTQFTGTSGSQQVFSINYASTTATTVDTSFIYASLGYATSSGTTITANHPLTVLGFRNTTGHPVGFQLAGNSGADGGGILASGILYAGDIIQGFTVHAFYRETYNATDPSHCNLFILLGHPSWGSVFGTISSFADPVANGGNGCFFYTSGAGVSNILAIQTLLSKAGGALVTSTECQTVVQAFVNRVKLAVGF